MTRSFAQAATSCRTSFPAQLRRRVDLQPTLKASKLRASETEAVVAHQRDARRDVALNKRLNPHWTSRPVEPERQRRRVQLDSLTEDRIPRRDQDAAKRRNECVHTSRVEQAHPLTDPTLATTWRRSHSASDRRNWARLRYRVEAVMTARVAGADWVGAGLTPAPPTPPDVRVRIRRFAQHSRKRR